LEPIKEEFGSSLCWSDLIILAGKMTVVDELTTPMIEPTNSLILGPNALQEDFSPCAVQIDILYF
jgi:hypothetical protein